MDYPQGLGLSPLAGESPVDMTSGKLEFRE